MKQDRVIVITGAAGGMGSVLVDRFLANGDSVVATDGGAALEILQANVGANTTDASTTFCYVIKELSARRVGYVCLLEPNARDLKTGTVQIEHVAKTFRRSFPDRS